MKRKIFRLSGIILICLFYSLNMSSQSRWSFVGTGVDKFIWYVDTTTIKKKSGTILAWEKVIYQDKSYSIILDEFKCSEKLKRLIKMTNYDPFGNYLSRDSNSLTWDYILPDSVEELLFNFVCKKAESEENTTKEDAKVDIKSALAKIIVKKAKLMSEANSNSEVIRELGLGEKLVLITEESVGVWYKVLDLKTNSQGWLHGNNFKIIKAKKSVSRFGKGRKN